MASLRKIKKDIDYLVNEVVYDCYLSMFFHEDKKEQVIGIIEEAVELRNRLIEQVNNPAEKHNPHLVKKHYAHLRTEMFTQIDELFAKLSGICQAA